MEILNITEHVIEYWFFIILAGSMLLLFGSMAMVGLSRIISKQKTKGDTRATALCVIISTIMVISLVDSFSSGVRVTYEVKVNDWNEVFDQGYEVIKQKGEIATVRQKQ